MRGTPGYLRIWRVVFRHMASRAVRREVFPWIALGAPLAAWLLPGQAGSPVMPLAISAVTWCWPAAFISGWPRSGDRQALAGMLRWTRAGISSLAVPEILLPFLAGSVPALLLVLAWSRGTGQVHWQVWTVIPFSSLTAVSATLLLEKYLGVTGGIINLAGFMAQASAAPWAASGIFQLAVLQGYPLWTIRWAGGSSAVLHGDIYAFFAVLAGTGLAILAFRALSQDSLNGN